MTLRLGRLIVAGEINNTSRYSTTGWLQLRGFKTPLHLELTGDCSPDLAGKRLCFEARDQPNEEAGPECDDLPDLAWQQVGPTGTMTAARQLGEDSRPCLYLEWHSQNGRVVVELVDPILEFVESEEQDEPEAAPMPRLLPEPEKNVPADDPSILSVPFGKDGETEEDDMPPAGWQDSEDDRNDPYGLFSESLHQQFDDEAEATDRAWRHADDADKPRDLRELELMDELIEHHAGEPIIDLIVGPLQCPRPEALDDEQVERHLKAVLAELALFGIKLHLCEHFTPRNAYRLLLEEICPEQRAYRELRGTQWVQTFTTMEFCQQCEAEFDREYEEMERRQQQEPPPESLGEEDLPW